MSGSQSVKAQLEGGLLDRLLGSLHTKSKMLTKLAPLGWSLAGLTVCTELEFHFRLNLASSGFLDLVLVVAVSAYGGLWEATVTSVAAVVCLNYFFVPPIFTFAVREPANWVALGAFEFTAVVIARLSRGAQMRAAEAIAQQRDSERLYQTARRILLLERSREPGTTITAMICELFDLRAAVLFDAQAARTYASGDPPPQAEERTRSRYLLDSDEFDPETHTWFCVLRLGARPVGGLALCNCRMTPLVATALASLCAIAFERTHSFEKECRIEAARQTEALRTAVLDGLAHEFKTPLATIWTSSSGLLAAGGLSETQTELVSMIDEQSQRLNHLASRLLGAAKLDSAELKPQRELLRLSNQVAVAIEEVGQPECRGRFRVSLPAHEPLVVADRKLIATALGQLLDNALKYSIPESPIVITVVAGDAEVITAIRSEGMAVSPADRERIFERFYRAAGAEHRPAGTGLGLSIVKKIVDAHHGRVWVTSEQDSGTVFSLALPIGPTELP